MALLLPSELKHHIAELSSPNSLAALARTHTAYQREAEKVLYHTLSIFAFYDGSLKCMKTLARNPEKAALVRFLTILYGYEPTIAHDNIRKNRRVATYLSKSLINMHSLSDFRVKSIFGGKVEEKMIASLDNILCGGHFRLQTLYIENVINISQIIMSQTELQILGLYTIHSQESYTPKVLKTLEVLHTAQLFLPIVLILESGSFLPSANRISIFPAFYSVDRRATMHQVLAQSFILEDQNIYMRLSIYSSDLPSTYAFAKDMAAIFPKIDTLDLWFERRCEIPLQEIKEEFSFFSNLCCLNCNEHGMQIRHS